MKEWKKKLFMLLTLALLVTGLSGIKPMMARAEETQDDLVDLSRMLEKHDMETGEVSLVSMDAETAMRDGEVVTCSSSYIPEGLYTEDMARKVIGEDGRTQVDVTSLSPYSAIAQLEI